MLTVTQIDGTILELTKEQEDLVYEAVRYIKSGGKLFQYSAPAGCGKSVVLRAIVQELGYADDEIAPMAYTGAASMVMRTNSFHNATTCHSWLYYIKRIPVGTTRSGKVKYIVKYGKKALPPEIKLILIDEASMIPWKIRKDIERHDIPVVACGDLNQLPPIADYPAYLNQGKIYYLTQIMRQARMSSIVLLANQILRGEPLRPGNYGEVVVIPANMLSREQIISSEIIICGYNDTRENLTNIIRQARGYRSEIPSYGEQIVCRENNWNIQVGDLSLVNGMLGTCVSRDNSISAMVEDEKYGRKSFFLDFNPKGSQYVFEDIEADYNYFVSNQTERDAIKRRERENPRIPRKNKFEFGYAITTHMSQGSQYNQGIYMEETFRKDQINLNYTGLTRFRDRCIYVLPYNILEPIPTKKMVMVINGQCQI